MAAWILAQSAARAIFWRRKSPCVRLWRLRDQLEATGRYRVIMTRDLDRTVQLRDRLQIARQSHGELFISLHADSW